MAYKPHWSHGLYALEAYEFRKTYKGAKKERYNKTTAFSKAVGYSAPGLAMELATKGMKARYGIPAAIGASIVGGIATDKAVKRFGRHPKPKRRRTRVKKQIKKQARRVL